MGKRYVPRRLMSRKEKKKPAGIAVAVPMVCLVLLVVLIGAVIGRYLRQLDSEGSARAREFYFTSDFLDGGNHILAPGRTEVTFTLRNHEDELRFSEVDIKCKVEVSVTSADGETLVPAEGVTVTPDTEMTLTRNEKSDGNVTIGGLEPGKTYTVTATGTGGYKKALTATIQVLPGESVVYKYLDTTNSEYVLLTVWAQGYMGSVTITPPAGLIPDNTDRVMESVKTVVDPSLPGASFTDATSFSTDGYASHTYRFFGSGVTAGDFTVTYENGSKSAEVKTPS